MDFKLSTDGDLVKVSDYLETVTDMEANVQLAMCKIASVTHDWFYDNYGCDLEQLLGRPLNNETLMAGEELIRSELTKLYVFDNSDIVINSDIIDNEFIGFNIYISDDKIKYYYYLIEVAIDIIGQINVKYGGSSKCLF